MYLYPYPGAGVQPVPSLSGPYRGIPVSNQRREQQRRRGRTLRQLDTGERLLQVM
jgi:hypothetical protein